MDSQAEVRLPPWLLLALGAALLLGGALGASTGPAAPAHRLLNALFFAAAFGYLGASLVDFAEHFRLERAASGRYLNFVAVPLGESVNHALTTITIVLALVLARPLPAALEGRDVFVLLAPGLFLALGWRDELVYHRRRCAHREDLMHTTAHLAAGVMLAAFYATRLRSW